MATRRATADAISIIGPKFPGHVILHWFSGSMRELERAVENGLYFSVNPAMMRSEKGGALVSAIPRGRVLTETDGPFVQMGKTPATPPDVASVIHSLASTWRMSADETAQAILRNFKGLGIE